MAFVRGWLAGAVAFVVVFVVVRWVMRQIWPDQGYLSDLATDLLRAGTSLALAAAAGALARVSVPPRLTARLAIFRLSRKANASSSPPFK